MSDLLTFLNTNSGALSAVFSGVVTIATLIYAWLTAKLVTETRQMRMVQTEPRIQITYRTRDEWINLLDISIRNIGLGPAQDITFEVRSISAGNGTDALFQALMKLNLFKNGLRYLGPAQDFTSFWASLADGDGSKLDTQIAVVCKYKSVLGVAYENEHVLDISELKGISKIGSPPMLAIAKHLESLQKDVHSLTSGFKRLRVDTFTQQDRDAERAAEEAEVKAWRERGQ